MTQKKCSSCELPVIWAVHTKTKRRSPIDAVPSEEGNVVFEHEPGLGSDPVYRVLTRAECAEPATTKRFTNHFMTCVNAKHHRNGVH
jgi:hypothetical protein